MTISPIMPVIIIAVMHFLYDGSLLTFIQCFPTHIKIMIPNKHIIFAVDVLLNVMFIYNISLS